MRLNKDQEYGYNRYLDYLHYKASEVLSLKSEAEYKVRADERLEIAKKLLKRNLSNEEIAEDTGLTIDQIQEIRNQLKK